MFIITNTGCEISARHRAKDEYKINFLHVYSPSVTSMTGLISEPGSAGPLSWFGSAGLISWTGSVGLISGAGSGGLTSGPGRASLISGAGSGSVPEMAELMCDAIEFPMASFSWSLTRWYTANEDTDLWPEKAEFNKMII